MIIRRSVLRNFRNQSQLRDLHPGPPHLLQQRFPSSASTYGTSFGDHRGFQNDYENDTYADADPETEVFLAAGKSHYRRRESLPEWMSKKQKEICQYRTKAQIRRCLKKWMVQIGRDFEKKVSVTKPGLERDTQNNWSDKSVRRHSECACVRGRGDYCLYALLLPRKVCYSSTCV